MAPKLVSIIITTYNRKQDIEKCLDSIFNNDYNNIRIIVVDNASSDGTADFLEQKYGSKINLIKSDKNLMAGGGRNLGAESAKGEYLLFIDSDNIIDSKMISELVTGMEKNKNAGMVGPLMYYLSDPKMIWWAGANINLWTSKTSYIGINEYDEGQYDDIMEVGHIPNVFLVKKEIWDEIGGINEDYIMHYEESDLAERIKRKDAKLYRIPTAKTYHNIPASSDESGRNFGAESLERVYYTSRNRIIFIKRNASIIQYIFFCLFFLMPFSFFYITKYKGFKMKMKYLIGLMDGLIWKK